MSTSWEPPKEKPAVESGTTKPLYRRWWFVAIALLVALPAIGSVFSRPSSEPSVEESGGTELVAKSTSTSSSTTTQPPRTWREILKGDVASDGLLDSLCELLSSNLDETLGVIGERLELADAALKDGFSSQEFRGQAYPWDQVQTNHVRNVEKGQSDVALIALRNSSVEEPSIRQVAELLNEAHSVCGLTEKFSELRASAESLDTKRDAIWNLAKTAPWYPKGFDVFSGNIAYRFLKYGSEFKCSFYGATCWGVEVVTKTGCNSLYAELTIFDSSNRNIGWTNDTATSIRPNERVVLVFDTYEDGADTGRISEMSCY